MTTQTQNQSDTPHTPEQLDVMSCLVQKTTALGLNVKLLPQVSVGPLVSLYRLLPTGSTKVSQLEALAQDFAIALHAEDVFIERIPGEAAVGVSVPNRDRKPVLFADLMPGFLLNGKDRKVPLNFGVTWKGTPFIEDLAELPHLFVAGSTGGGKSTLLNSMLASLIMTKSPLETRLILCDLKQVEFTHFVGTPHLLFEPAVNVYQALERLEWCIDKMHQRLKKLASHKCRDIHAYRATGKQMAFIVFVIDEVAMILGCDEKNDDKQKLGKLAGNKLAELVSLSRAAGVYIIAASQRPSVNVVSGTIKANFPARISFKLPSEADSRTILTEGGAEHLLSRGDMLYMSPHRPGLLRLHAPFTTQNEISEAIKFAQKGVK